MLKQRIGIRRAYAEAENRDLSGLVMRKRTGIRQAL